jgi:hypothetical protein
VPSCPLCQDDPEVFVHRRRAATVTDRLLCEPCVAQRFENLLYEVCVRNDQRRWGWCDSFRDLPATCTERPSQHPSAAKDTARRAFPVEPIPGAVVMIRPRATCSYQTGSRGMGFRPRRPCRNTSKRPG